jgi:uncharacterized protein DUF4382
MRLTLAENARHLWHNCWNIPFHAALLLAVWVTGCSNTCFTFNSNPPTGTIGIKASDPSPSCTLAKANGAIRLQIDAEPACSSCAGSVNVQHVFVTIRGIEVHPSMMADDDPTDWQRLAPQLAKQPLQVDLVRDTADQDARELLGEIVTLPAGIYRQLRVRFVPNQPTDRGSTSRKERVRQRGTQLCRHGGRPRSASPVRRAFARTPHHARQNGGRFSCHPS